MCELNCFVKEGYYYCKETGERCPDGLFDKPSCHTPLRAGKLGTEYSHRHRKPYADYPIPQLGYKPPFIYSEREPENFELEE